MNNDINEKIVHAAPVPPFVRFVASAVPMVFDNSLSYYEALCALWKWLQDDVINVINNNANVTEQYITLTNELKEYVENYFANLDVQEEINNKLDDMAEDGTLQEIITEYIQANTAWCFDTVADMKTATNFIAGSFAQTLGFHAINDGGKAIYRVRTITNADVVDEARIIALSDNTLVAELVESYPVNVRQLGVAGDGVTDDTLAIQHAIDTTPRGTLYFPDGTYLVSSTITTSATDNLKVFLQLSKNATIKASAGFSGAFVLAIGSTGIATNYESSVNNTGIDGGIIDANGVCGGVQVTKTHVAKVKNLSIINVLTAGLQIDESNNDSSDAYVENVDIKGTNAHAATAIGVILNGADNNLIMVRTFGLHIGIQVNGGGNYLTQCHPLYNDSEQAWYETSIGFDIHDSNTWMTDCYSDNFSTAIQINGDRTWFANNFFAYWYTNENVAHTGIRNKSRYFRGVVDGLQIRFPVNGTNRGLIIDETGYTNPYPEMGSVTDDYEGGRISNLSVPHWDRLTYKYSDPIFLSKLNRQYVQTLASPSGGMVANKWYPIAFFSGFSAEQQLEVTIGNMMIELELNVSSNIWLHDIKVIDNNDGNVFKFGVGKITELADVYILYYMMTDKQSTYTDWPVITRCQPPYSSRQMILPRDCIHLDPTVLGGIDTMPSGANETYSIDNKNRGCGFFCLSGNKTTHEVQLTSINGPVHAVLLFLRTSSSTGFYAIYNGKILDIDTTNMQITPTMSISNNVLTITTPGNSTINYIRL